VTTAQASNCVDKLTAFAARPGILNGIEDVVYGSDPADRAIFLAWNL